MEGVATTTPALQAAQTTGTITYQPEVFPDSARWGESLAFFTIHLIAPVNFGLNRRVGNCVETMSSSTVSDLGTAPVCEWIADTSVRVYPDRDATLGLLAGVDLNLSLNLTDSDGDVYMLLSSSVEAIEPPSGELTPVIAALNAQASVGPCTDLVLDASGSESPSGRPLDFVWNVTGTSATPAPSALIDLLTKAKVDQQGEWNRSSCQVIARGCQEPRSHVPSRPPWQS